MHGPHLNKAMRNVIGLRRECGPRSTINLLGRMSNPARVTRQVIGIYSPQYAPTVAETLGRFETRRAFVPATVSELRDGAVRTYRIHPDEFGEMHRLDEIVGGAPERNAGITLQILQDRGNQRSKVSSSSMQQQALSWLGRLIRCTTAWPSLDRV